MASRLASAFGNAEARRLLAENAPFDVFVVGWSTTLHERKAMVSWLKQRWRAIPVVAIHDSFQNPIQGADVTATHDTPEQWKVAVRFCHSIQRWQRRFGVGSAGNQRLQPQAAIPSRLYILSVITRCSRPGSSYSHPPDHLERYADSPDARPESGPVDLLCVAADWRVAVVRPLR